MNNQTEHSFHIPVMGLGFTIDTPLKVAKYGISSVLSIMEDHLIEEMRRVYFEKYNLEYTPIVDLDRDRRSKRITSYLNFVNDIVNQQIEQIRNQSFTEESDLTKYFELLPENSYGKLRYIKMLQESDRLEREIMILDLKSMVIAGSIDVNIMTKLDNQNFSKSGERLPEEYSDAKTALKGFAESNLSSSVILSAGMNPKLFSYFESFADFYPNEYGELKKKVILKVSDYRSALIQGKIFAKKGIWISEFRIESGLNCGGHAFATQGLLLGPILEEFKEKKQELHDEMFQLCETAILEKQISPFIQKPSFKITVQGGIGTSAENSFLMNQYNLDGTGWGSPFLLVPESTNVDDRTINALVNSKKEDFYLSNSSPLGVPFNNFRNTTSEDQRNERISKGKPGSPCYKKFLSNNTEFTEEPICTASRQYQKLKIEQIERSESTLVIKDFQKTKVMEKDCLCEGLGTTAILQNNGKLSHKLEAVSICPGPNLFFFKSTFSLSEMVDHIYGRFNALNKVYRPHVFVNEAQLYVDYLKKEIETQIEVLTQKQKNYFEQFKQNLEEGLNYYSKLMTLKEFGSKVGMTGFNDQINQLKLSLHRIQIG
ncbi:MAG: hypothetical protein WC044_08855 [Crocinitomicaceae bacterium]